MMDIEFDERLGILRCVSRGSTSLADIEAFGRKATSLQARARARLGNCLILVDASETPVHTKEAAAHFSEMAATRFKAGDRTAILIASALAKLQSQRMTTKDATAYLTSEAEALAWLLDSGKVA